MPIMINPTIIIALTRPTHLTHLITNLKIIMKKEFYHRTALLLLISVLFFACNKGNNKSELCPDGYACCNGPTFFLFYIDKEKVGANFFEQVQIQKTSEGKTEVFKKDYIQYYSYPEKKYDLLSFIIFTSNKTEGEAQDIYTLQTPSKQYTITIKGKYVDPPCCCATSLVEEVLLNGKKWEYKQYAELGEGKYLVIDN